MRTTPGPWTISEGARTDQWVVERIGSCAEDSAQVADVYTGENDARLIAAAPRLLKAVAALAGLEKDGEVAFPTIIQINEARAILRDVEGETANGS